jgi:hemerythrin-like domain-containing protein
LGPALEAKGFPRHGGPTGVMMQEHETGRTAVRGMAEAIEKDDAKGFARHGRAYIELLRQHIQKEDHCLFNMADQALNPADQASLLAAFEHVEYDHMGAGTHEKFLQLANDLANKYNVLRTGETVHHCCCHH